mmetsp:Transcript_28102/g.65532  ORF Transcript_28102/g.65532 Transcript_28102/m.65532 type:complete len:354 (+) Transcript_28102:1034-2095(+)
MSPSLPPSPPPTQTNPHQQPPHLGAPRLQPHNLTCSTPVPPPLNPSAQTCQGQGWGGFSGQLSALTKFKLSSDDIERLRLGLRNTPVLIMSGTKDRIVHPDSGRLLHRYLTHDSLNLGSLAPPLCTDTCRLVRLEAGHFLPIQKRREVASSLVSLWHQACPNDPPQPLNDTQAKKQGRIADAFSSLTRLATCAPKALSSLSSLSSLSRLAAAAPAARRSYQRASLSFVPRLEGLESKELMEEEEERAAIAAELTCKFGEAHHEIQPARYPPTSRSEEALEMLDLRGDWGPDDEEDEEALWVRAKQRLSREEHQGLEEGVEGQGQGSDDAKGWSDAEEDEDGRPALAASSLWYH